MAKEGVNIPVRVTGAEQAQGDLRATGEAITGVGQAAQQAAAGVRQLNAAAGDADQAAFAAWRAQEGGGAAAAGDSGGGAVAAHEKTAEALRDEASAADRAEGATRELNKSSADYGTQGGRALQGILAAISPELGAIYGLAERVIRVFGSMNVTMLGIAGAAAGITAVVSIMRALEEEAERVQRALRKLDEARRESAGAAQPAGAAIQEDLLRYTPYSREKFGQAARYYASLLQQGTPIKVAQQVAAEGYVSGVSPEDLATALMTGERPETPEQAQQMVARLKQQPGVWAELEKQRGRQLLTHEGVKAVAEGVVLRDEMKRPGSRYYEQFEGVSPDLALLEKGKELGLLKPKAGVERIGELMQEWESLRLMVEFGNATASERARFELLKPLAHYREQLQLALPPTAPGVPGAEPVRPGQPAAPPVDFRPSGPAPWAPPERLSPEATTTIYNVNNISIDRVEGMAGLRSMGIAGMDDLPEGRIEP